MRLLAYFLYWTELLKYLKEGYTVIKVLVELEERSSRYLANVGGKTDCDGENRELKKIYRVFYERILMSLHTATATL